MEKLNITSAKYFDDPITGQSPGGILVTIDGVEMSIPLDLQNRHYAEIMRQVEAGELTIEEAV